MTSLKVGLLELIVPPLGTLTDPIRESVARPKVKALGSVVGSSETAKRSKTPLGGLVKTFCPPEISTDALLIEPGTIPVKLNEKKFAKSYKVGSMSCWPTM